MKLPWKKLLFLICMIFLVCFSIIFSLENRNGFTLGDFIFFKLGIPAWSGGYTGFHYTVIVTFVLFFLGLWGLGKAKYELNISTSKVIVIFILCAALYQPSFNFLYGRIRQSTGGLSSVDYIRKLSTLKIEETEGVANIEGEFVFHNYSREEKWFRVKLLKSDQDAKVNPRCDYLVETVYFEDDIIVIPPQSEMTVIIDKTTTLNGKYKMLRGKFTGVDIGIYNTSDSVDYIERRY